MLKIETAITSKLENFLKLTQEELFNQLCKKYRSNAVIHKGGYILVPGKAPVMLIAHLDTVHKKAVDCICKSASGNILMSPQGIGGDDRCGVYALVNIYEAAEIKPWLLFTCDEEIGGIGAEMFVEDYSKSKAKSLNKLKLLIEIDRRGSRDAVYYDCDNPEFEAYITSKGFTTEYGSFSDISVIAPELGVAAVNLSSGYYNPHTLYEYINRKHINAVILSVINIIAESVHSDFPRYKYIECAKKFRGFSAGFDMWDSEDKTTPLFETKSQDYSIPSDLPSSLINIYTDLLELYTRRELEYYREKYGNSFIYQLYYDEFDSFLDTNRTSGNEHLYEF